MCTCWSLLVYVYIYIYCIAITIIHIWTEVATWWWNGSFPDCLRAIEPIVSSHFGCKFVLIREHSHRIITFKLHNLWSFYQNKHFKNKKIYFFPLQFVFFLSLHTFSTHIMDTARIRLPRPRNSTSSASNEINSSGRRSSVSLQRYTFPNVTPPSVMQSQRRYAQNYQQQHQQQQQQYMRASQYVGDHSGLVTPVKPVYKLMCRHCTTPVCARGMKAILLADTTIELYSTDTPSQWYVVFSSDRCITDTWTIIAFMSWRKTTSPDHAIAEFETLHAWNAVMSLVTM